MTSEENRQPEPATAAVKTDGQSAEAPAAANAAAQGGQAIAAQEADRQETDAGQAKEAEQQLEKLSELSGLIQTMVGAEDFKKLALELMKTAPLLEATQAYRALFFQNFLFSINDGCGLTTALHLLKELVEVLRLYRRPALPEAELTAEQLAKLQAASVLEIKLERPEHLADSEPLDKVLYHLSELQLFPKVISFDISNWSFYTGDSRFKEFLQELSDIEYDCLFIFRVPFLADDILEDIRRAINDVMFVRTIKFVPPTNQEYYLTASRILQRYHFQLADDAIETFYQILAEEKNDGHFYGLRTVDKLINQIIYGKLLLMAEQEERSLIISREELAQIFGQTAKSEQRGLDLLDNMVGMNTVKQQLLEIVELLEVRRKANYAEPTAKRPGINLQFTGKPGTGKSRVARILGSLLKENQLLSLGNVIEVEAQNLCGRYPGETIPKVSAICRDAYGSILLINNPVSLYRGRGNSEMGLEVTETLLAEIENRGNDLAVVLAGNAEDMALFLENNPQLAERFDYEIKFPDYTRTDLRRIFFKMVTEKVHYDDKFVAAIDDFFHRISDQQLNSAGFSNARMVRNLYELILARATVRTRVDNNEEIRFLAEDVSKAISEKKFKELLERREEGRIGFNI